MGILRAALLVIVLCLVCRPQLVAEHEIKIRSIVAVWVDSSASMSLQDTYNGAKSDPEIRTNYMHKVGAGDQRLGQRGHAGPCLAGFEMAANIAGCMRNGCTRLPIRRMCSFLRDIGTPNRWGSRPIRRKSMRGSRRSRRRCQADGSTTDVPAIVQDILQRSQGQRLKRDYCS